VLGGFIDWLGCGAFWSISTEKQLRNTTKAQRTNDCSAPPIHFHPDGPRFGLSSLLSERELSHRYRCKTIRRECVSVKRRIGLGKPGTWMKSRRRRGLLYSQLSSLNPQLSQYNGQRALLAKTFGVGSRDWATQMCVTWPESVLEHPGFSPRTRRTSPVCCRSRCGRRCEHHSGLHKMFRRL